MNEQYSHLRKPFLEFMKGSIFVPPTFGMRQLVNIYKGSTLAKHRSFGDLMQVVSFMNQALVSKDKELMALVYDPTLKTTDTFLKKMGEYLNVLVTRSHSPPIQPFSSK